MENNSLQHYGVLGMKWGVRRSQAQLGRVEKRVAKLKAKKNARVQLERAKNKLAKAKAEEVALKAYIKKGKTKAELKAESKTNTDVKMEKKSGSNKKRKLKDLSNEEIQSRIDRMNLEQRYVDLVKSQRAKARPSQESSGKKDHKVLKFLGSTAKSVVLEPAVDVGKQYVKSRMVDWGNQKIGKTKRVKNEETGNWETILEEILYTNNKKK